MRSTEIRRTFFDFFAARGHRRVPSSPLVPSDPTLLLANAGMNQFKPYFLDGAEPAFRRAMSVQKCVRTSDIENVGRTTRHATFFEMLGNFSFGDYFKREAIAWAWELLTEGYGLDPGRLWVTVYLDDESERIWRSIGVPAARIQRLGMADNYWSMGVPGPCGPSTELCYDRGPAFGAEGGPAADDERYVELWNLVFMQNLRGEGPPKEGYPIVGELPKRNIDTGLGMDRLAAILQGVDTVCQTDLLAPVLETVQELAGRPFPGRDGSAGSVSFQVVTEHARSIAFLVADGVLPGNEGRGYVLRRLMRRALRHARLLGIDGPVLPPATGAVVAGLGADWPELTAHAALIEQVTAAEEESFDRTLRQGTRLLDGAIDRARGAGSPTLPGETAFELHDTYGFPLDLTLEAAHAAGLTVDEDRFGALLEEQRRRAKSHGRGRTAAALARLETYREISARSGLTDFVGYGTTEADGTVVALLAGGVPAARAGEGREVEVVLDRTPFYAEGGGQVGDSGTVTTRDGAVIEITGTRPGIDGLHVHTGRVGAGEVGVGEEVLARVDADRRAAVARSHSATHVLHAMLRRVLGGHVRQQGSLVEAGRLRFDFAHFPAVSDEELRLVSSLVNEALAADPEVRVWHASRAEAEAAGAIAMFGEKYGETVRIVDIGDVSRELCGGTHVGHGSAAGPVHLVGESSVGANLRRVEALTGLDALRHIDRERQLLDQLTAALGVPRDQALGTLSTRVDGLADAERRLAGLRRAELEATAERLAATARGVGPGWLVATQAPGADRAQQRALAQSVLARRGPGPAAVVLAARVVGKAALAATVSPELRERGVAARDLLTAAARAVGGGAGGRGAVADAGGREVEHLDRALTLAAEEAARTLTSA
ncbi:alanine--tRNA ligase [Actinomadura kijaniata]|uniref:alanine--tRNA ligase n=1 Tax=Actinomadura kijaniata TaxID=46161 RepID=UPI002FEB9E5D